jgi:hypothetical protein
MRRLMGITVAAMAAALVVILAGGTAVRQNPDYTGGLGATRHAAQDFGPEYEGG